MDDDRIKLEDLLKLKRTEQPTEAEWANFDERLKGKLVSCIVRKRTLSDRFFELVSPVRAAAFGAAGLAALGAVFAPMYIAGLAATSSSESSSEFKVSSTPLPRVAVSYTVNEVASNPKSEIPVFAQMNSNESSDVRYVASSVASGINLF